MICENILSSSLRRSKFSGTTPIACRARFAACHVSRHTTLLSCQCLQLPTRAAAPKDGSPNDDYHEDTRRKDDQRLPGFGHQHSEVDGPRMPEGPVAADFTRDCGISGFQHDDSIASCGVETRGRVNRGKIVAVMADDES